MNISNLKQVLANEVRISRTPTIFALIGLVCTSFSREFLRKRSTPVSFFNGQFFFWSHCPAAGSRFAQHTSITRSSFLSRRALRRSRARRIRVDVSSERPGARRAGKSTASTVVWTVRHWGEGDSRKWGKGRFRMCGVK